MCLPFLLGTVGTGGQFNDRVERNLHPGRLRLRHIHKVCVNASQNGLMGDHHDVFATLHLHDDGFETNDDITVGLSAMITVVISSTSYCQTGTMELEEERW